MIGENFDFFVKLKDMQTRNVSFSEAGQDQLSVEDIAPKPLDQLPSAPSLMDLLAKSSKLNPIESNLILGTAESSSIHPETPSSSLNDVPKPTPTPPKLPFLGKVSEIYPPGFTYSPPDICNASLQLIIVVTSAPGNVKARNAIRQTWGQFNSTDPVKLVFIVGNSIPKNEKNLKDEYAAHADIIHGNFIDSYYNLTLKTISMLEWIKSNCKMAKFILKADDDTFINVNKLLDVIKSRNDDKMTIYGRVGHDWTPFRDPQSKYYISYDEFADSVFPDFTSGPAYLMTSDCAELIYNETLEHKYLKLEDVFITGIIASQLHIQRIDLKEFVNEKPTEVDPCQLKDVFSDKEEDQVSEVPSHQWINFDRSNDPKVSDIYTSGFSNLPSLICKGDDENPKLLIIISSAPENYEARKAIRYAWGDTGLYDQVQFAFIMGKSESAQESKIVDEIVKYGDIIRGKFMENEENLTTKSILMLEWISSNCENARFILKTDDQTFVNIDKLLKVIDGKLQDTKSIYGKLSKSLDPVGVQKSKFHVIYDKYYGKVYPEFAAGPVYLMTGDCVKLVYDAALDAKFFKVENVFITGIIANHVGIKRLNMDEIEQSVPNVITKCNLRDVVSISGVSADQHYDLWFAMNDGLD
ncbi:uncharacterized protein [Chironomus tepperi]|uniref:uncharacterized protein n=1 Tax=Chironomus tepperi TaxID=113505 RepID=UPI00391F7265